MLPLAQTHCVVLAGPLNLSASMSPSVNRHPTRQFLPVELGGGRGAKPCKTSPSQEAMTSPSGGVGPTLALPPPRPVTPELVCVRTTWKHLKLLMPQPPSQTAPSVPVALPRCCVSEPWIPRARSHAGEGRSWRLRAECTQLGLGALCTPRAAPRASHLVFSSTITARVSYQPHFTNKEN